MTARRELRAAVLLCLVGSGLVLLALGQTWFSTEDGRQLTIQAVRTSVRGSRLAAGADALGYVGLAGVVALAATKRWGRVLVGLLVLAAGVGVVVVAGQALADGLAVRGQRLQAGLHPRSEPVWAWLTVLGGTMLAASGALVAVRGRRWAALSTAYEVPAAQPVHAPVTDKGVWDALDRGEDPTT